MPRHSTPAQLQPALLSPAPAAPPPSPPPAVPLTCGHAAHGYGCPEPHQEHALIAQELAGVHKHELGRVGTPLWVYGWRRLSVGEWWLVRWWGWEAVVRALRSDADRGPHRTGPDLSQCDRQPSAGPQRALPQALRHTSPPPLPLEPVIARELDRLWYSIPKHLALCPSVRSQCAAVRCIPAPPSTSPRTWLATPT